MGSRLHEVHRLRLVMGVPEVVRQACLKKREDQAGVLILMTEGLVNPNSVVELQLLLTAKYYKRIKLKKSVVASQ
jgi:hypothetical protein